MIDLNLFRLKVFPSAQRELWGELTPPEIFRQTISSLPSAEFRRGNVWHIGNLQQIDDDWGYFRFSKSARTKVEIYTDGKFVDAQFEAAPYTHVLVHYPLEIIAIAKKPKLSPNVLNIAKRLRRILEFSNKATELHAHFEISIINDPQSFIHLLNTAYSITRFSYEFDRKNLFDVDQDFFLPLEKAIAAVNGKKGIAVLKGDELRKEPLEAIARSAASSGNEVSATIKKARNSRKLCKKMKGNPAAIQVGDLSSPRDLKKAAAETLEKYEQVRRAPPK